MDVAVEAIPYRFDDFVLDVRDRALFRLDDTGAPVPVQLGSRAFAILCVLVERRGGFVSKQQMMDAVWPDVTVEDSNLTVQMSALRRVLDAGRGRGSCIETIPGRGYRFISLVGHDAATTFVNDTALFSKPHRGEHACMKPKPVNAVDWPAPLDRPRLSIVVLPFENLSNDPEQNYLGEGIADDLTTDLSRVPGMVVIVRRSAHSHLGNPENPRKIGEQLGVRYVIEGSVRGLGDSVRVNARLVATETGAHLWADRFDQQLNDLSAAQEAIVRRIGPALNAALADIESARSKRERPTNPDAFDLILRAQAIALHPLGPRQEAAKLALFEQALQLDPKSISAMTGIAYALIERNRCGDDLERAAKILSDAAAINPDDEAVLANTGYSLYVQGRSTRSLFAFQRVLAGNPGCDWAYNVIGACLPKLGRAEEAIPMLEKAIRLDPRSGYLWSRYMHMGWAMLMLERDEEAIVWMQRALAANPNNRPDWRAKYTLYLAAAHARLGHLEEAHRLVAEANGIWPYATVRGCAPDDLSSPIYVAQFERYRAGLRLAGLRDHADEDADFGVPADDKMQQDFPFAGHTPKTVRGATTIHTAELERLLTARKPIVIDPLLNSWGRSIPGAIGLKNAGWGSSAFDTLQNRFSTKVRVLTDSDFSYPVVAVGWNSECFDGRNLALRLAALGYTQVYWYRGGREAWQVNGLPDAPVAAVDW